MALLSGLRPTYFATDTAQRRAILGRIRLRKSALFGMRAPLDSVLLQASKQIAHQHPPKRGSQMTYQVIENAGTDQQRVVFETQSYLQAIWWKKHMYSGDDYQKLKVDILKNDSTEY